MGSEPPGNAKSRRKRRLRRLLWGFAAFLLILAVLALSLPVWFPWVLKPVASRLKLTYVAYDREGYHHLTLRNVQFTEKSVIIRAERVRLMMPQSWAWQRSRTGTNQPPTFAAVLGWQITPLPTGNTNASTYKDVRAAEKVLRQLPKWLPKAALTNGTLHLGKHVIIFPHAIWLRGQLDATAYVPHLQQTAIVRADFTGDAPYSIDVSAPEIPLESRLAVSSDQLGLHLVGTNIWRENRILLQAHFARTGKLPETARLESAELRVPATMLGLNGYQDPAGKVLALWEDGGFTLEVLGGANPLRTNLPPVQLDLHARGTTSNAVVERMTVTLPGLNAELSENLQVAFSGPLLRNPAKLYVQADLPKQPWLENLSGSLRGAVDLQPMEGKYPEAVFRLAGTNVGHGEFQVSRLNLDGTLNWPLVDLENVNAVFEDDSVAVLKGRFDLEQKRAEHGQISFQGPLLKRWLPPTISYQDIAFVADFSGARDVFFHTGRVTVVNFSTPKFNPLRIKGEWSGRNTSFSNASLALSAGNSTVQLRGSGEVVGSTNQVHLLALDLLRDGEERMHLQSPAGLSFIRETNSPQWFASAGPLHWSGPAGDLQLNAEAAWPESGSVAVSVRNVSGDLLNDFFGPTLPRANVETLELTGGWTNGPFHFSAYAVGSAFTNIVQRFQARFSGNHEGVRISEFQVAGTSNRLLTAEGFVPVALLPQPGTLKLQLRDDLPLNFKAIGNAEGIWTQFFPGQTNIVLQQPEILADVSGTWQAPQGQVLLSAQEVRFRTSSTNVPTFRNFDLALQLDRDKARLTRGNLLLQDQPVNLTAELPLGDPFWSTVKAGKTPDWRQASAHLRVADAKLSALTELYPSYLSPQGKLDVDVHLRPGGLLDGHLKISGARTRPLPSIGPIRDIDLIVRFHDRVARLDPSSINVGGADVHLRGQAEVSGEEWLKDFMPPFVVTLQGTNVPLARQPETIIRSDLNLSVVHTNGAPPLISGTARLRNSFLLSDLGDLVPRDVAKPSRRPPYFSVDDPVLGDWRLGIEVSGTRFLKVRSTLLRGEVSQNMKLQGTLKDPIALGTMKIESGYVRFPFGSLQVEQGFVGLTSENPYQPQLNVSATGKQYGYDIRMELTGPANSPVIQFTSTPPLSSEQILLLLTAGEFPGGEYELTSQQRAQTLAMFLGRELLTKLGFGESGEERLLIRSGEEISEAGRPTYQVEYKLAPDWSIVGEYDRFGDFNVGGKWRFYSK